MCLYTYTRISVIQLPLDKRCAFRGGWRHRQKWSKHTRKRQPHLKHNCYIISYIMVMPAGYPLYHTYNNATHPTYHSQTNHDYEIMHECAQKRNHA